VAVDLKERFARYRAEEQRLSWEGTFLEYFEIVKKQPKVANLAHARMYDMIMDAGVSPEARGRTQYDFFAHDIFGLEKPLEQLVEYFSSAAKRLEVRKRILLLMGPVGGGKSTIVSLLKRGMEAYSRSEEGAVYAIKGCPMHEEPLHLVPPELRDEIRKEFGIYIEGDLCPACRQMVRDQHGGRMEDVVVQRIAFSEKNRIGIGTFTPSDPKSQDISELTGSVDLSTIGQYGSESDPRAYRFDGELNVANRGMMEFIEMLKCDEKFLYGLLTLSQEQNIKTGRFSMIYADECIPKVLL
jgi:serine protein kinase